MEDVIRWLNSPASDEWRESTFRPISFLVSVKNEGYDDLDGSGYNEYHAFLWIPVDIYEEYFSGLVAAVSLCQAERAFRRKLSSAIGIAPVTATTKTGNSTGRTITRAS